MRNNHRKDPYDESKIKSHKCEKMDHYVNECRSHKQNLPNFKNPINYCELRPIKEYSGNSLKYCSW